MKLKNTTTFSNDKVRQIIQFVKPNNLPTTKFDVKVTNWWGRYRGTFYPMGSIEDRPLLIARITPNETRFPYKSNNSTPKRNVTLRYWQYCEEKQVWEFMRHIKYLPVTQAYTLRRNQELRSKGKLYTWSKSTGGYLDYLLLSREEALVYVLAHEFRHFWQQNHSGKRAKVWGARGQYSDRDADAYAIRKTREWRKMQRALNNFIGGQ